VTDLHLEPLLAACRALGARSLTVFGSATNRPLEEVADLDLHLVIPRMDRAAHVAIVRAARATAQAAAAALARPWQLELRHGPFKPPPALDRTFQLHLIVDDLASLETAPCALRLQRSVTGRHVVGKPPPVSGNLSPARLLLEARRELTRSRDALLQRQIRFRHWELEPAPRLADGRARAATAWELRCLLAGLCVSADLVYLAAASPAAAAEEVALTALLAEEDRDWERLPARWSDVTERVCAILDRRLDRCARVPPARK
jgi:hypothetical protein